MSTATRSNLRAIIAEAQNQVTFAARVPVGFTEPTAYISKPAALSAVLGLNAETLPALVKMTDSHSYIAHAPFAPVGATTVTLAAAIAANSRVAQAGAHLIVRPDQDRAIATGHTGVVAMQRNIAQFRTVEAAPFASAQPDGEDPNDYAELAVSQLPMKGATLDWSQSIAKGVRFEIPRSMQKDVGEDLLANEILLSVVLGIARTADAVLLAKIAAGTPAAFTLAAAAARGLKFDELRSLVGTTGTGAAVGQDGTLRAAGVPAELTPDMAGTIAGSFARSAVAIHDEVQLHVERRNTRGDLVATCWAQFLPVVPDETAFFNVSA